MGFYDNLQNTADKLLKAKGQVIYVTQGTTTYTCTGAEFPVKAKRIGVGSGGTTEFAAQAQVLTNSRDIVLSTKGLTFTPKPGDTVKIGSGTVAWRTIGVTPLQPGGVPVFTRLTVVK